MILADKIILLRKKNGWSQEELAEKMNVSRQAVSKWEAAQSSPDLEKILLLGRIFGVTTDYLLKDEIETEEFTQDDFCSPARSVSLEDAGKYLQLRQWASKKIAIATALCILSPVCLILLAAVSGMNMGISENAAAFTGLAVLFLMVAAAAAMFIYTDSRNSPYKFLDEEDFELAYGVSGMVRDRQNKFRSSYVKGNIVGSCLCILAPLILLAGAFTERDLIVVLALCAMLAIIAAGVWQLISVGVNWGAMEKLLGEGEYSKKEKKRSKIKEAVSTAYWLSAVAVYLGWSFLTGEWKTSWLVWPVAGVLYPALMAIVNALTDKESQ